MNNILYTNDLSKLLPLTKDYSSVFILADSNTAQHCLSLLPAELREKELIIIPTGEENKNLENCSGIWQILTDKNADRHSLLINLGGGMITDLGGFAASTYKRGIDFINIPTSLLGMVDAAIGGKTGIDFCSYKNQIGTFCLAKHVVINVDFLNTLPKKEFKSGYAEVLKYGLIADRYLWHMLKERATDSEELTTIIERCIEIKTEITTDDPTEDGIRKLLNFGHTIGHAIEGLSMLKDKPVLHGQAIATGMMVESYLSIARGHLTEAEFLEIIQKIKTFCTPAALQDFTMDELMAFIRQDKKNSHSEIRFSLLKNIGTGIIDINVSEEEIAEAIGIVLNH